MFEYQSATKKARAILEKVARQEGVPLDEVRREISLAIQEAINSSDEAVRQKWDMCPRKGNIPTPEEAILFISGLVI